MAESRAVNTIGVGVYVATENGWKELMEVKSTPELGDNPSKIETTHLKCYSQTFIEGVNQVSGDLAITCNAIPRGLPNSNIDLVDSLKRGKSYQVSFRFPQTKVAVELTAQISGKIAAASTNGVQDFIVNFTPTSDPVIRVLTDEFKVTYEGNQPSGAGSVSGSTTDSMSYAAGAEATVKSNGFTLSGYTFTGWCDSPDGAGRVWKEGETLIVIDNVKLYAQWIKNE